MVRTTLSATLLALVVGGLLAPATVAEDTKREAAPVMATDEEVAEALKEFKTNWKAKGLRGDDRVMQRDFAMRQISELHHPEVVKALGKASRSSDEDVRLIAVIYLSDQKLLPHQAAQYILDAMKKHRKDVVMQMTALQALGALKYVGAAHQLRNALKHKQFVVRKAAITAVGDIGDTRMLPDVLKVLGVKLETDNKGKDADKKESKKETVSEGYSWEGAEAVVDRGEADNSKEMADAKRIAEAQIARNKAAAQAGKGGGGGGGGVGGVGGSGGRGGTARSTEEMIPAILRTLKKLTGEEFKKPSQIRIWVKDQKDWLESETKRLDKLEKDQKSAK